MIEKRDVKFQIEDVTRRMLAVRSRAQDANARLPAEAMAHGLGAVQEMYLEPFARRFAEEGIATLLFDHHYMGASASVADTCCTSPPTTRVGRPS